MANTIAHCTGADRTRQKTDHRLGSEWSEGQANTWRTHTTCHVNRDGSGYILVQRDGKTLHEYEFGPEGGETDAALPVGSPAD
jgi:hypothetical protein